MNIYLTLLFHFNTFTSNYEKQGVGMTHDLVCKTCRMRMKKETDFGTNIDGSVNKEHCIQCLKDGLYKQQDSRNNKCGGYCWKKS